MLRKKGGGAYKASEEALPNPEAIIAGVEMVIDQFPFGNTEEEDVDYSLLDSLQIAQIEEEFQVKQDQEAEEHWKMIKNDFPTLSEQEIAENLDVIDEYYSQNLDYVTLEAIVENEETISAKTYAKEDLYGSISSLQCFPDIALLYGQTKTLYAITVSGDQAKTTASNYYNTARGVTIKGSNDVKDTYRHMAWNALLAQNYFTVSSKVQRVNFAKAVTDRYETCNPNADDSREMDYHNNAIGRKIWDDNTTYRKVAGFTTGLKTPSHTELKRKVREYIDRFACFIIKEKREDDRFPENLRTNNLLIAEVVSKINTTSNNIPVYFIGPLKASTYVSELQSAGYEIIECDDRNSQGNGGTPTRGNPDGPEMCQRELF